MPHRSPSVASRPGEAGVTLLEVLVVLVLIGVGTALVTLSVRPDDRPGRTVMQEGALLAARLDIASEGRLVSGRPAALDWERDGYRFVEYDGEDWRAHRNARLAERQAVSRALSLDGAGGSGGRFVLDPDAAGQGGDPAIFRIGGEGRGVRVAFDGLSALVEGGQ